MLCGEKVLVNEPTLNDFWVKSFVGTFYGYDNDGLSVVENEEGYLYKIPLEKIRKPRVRDYITVTQE